MAEVPQAARASSGKTKRDASHLQEWKIGREVEQEHYAVLKGNQQAVDRIVRDHLKEDPHYYTKLRKCGMGK